MLRVLLVEDNQILREAFGESLSEHFPPMAIDEAGNSEEALQKITVTPPHFIFTDIRLPGISGLRLTQMIKKDFPNIRIAIVTGYDLPEYREAAVQYGAEGFFDKESLQWDQVEVFIKSIPGEGT